MEPHKLEEMKVEPYRSNELSSEDAVVESLGYEQKYRRVFGMPASLALVIIGSCPMFSDIIISYFPVVYGGFWGMTWGFIIPATLLIPLPLAIAELCSSMPINGALYWWTAALAPPKLSRPVSFMSGWTLLFSYITALASAGYGIAAILSGLISAVHPDWIPTNAQKMGIGMGIVCIWAFLNCLQMETLTIVFITIASVIVLEMLVYVIGIPAATARQGLPFNSGHAVFTEWSTYSDWDRPVAIPLSFLGAAYVANGWQTPASIVEETRNARLTAPRAIVYGYFLLVTVAFLPYLLAAFSVQDLESIALDPSGSPLSALAFQAWGQTGGTAFLIVVIAFQILGGGSAVFAMSSSIAAFARDGGLPFPKLFSYVHPKTNMPLPAIVLICCATIMILLLSLSTVAGSIIYSLAIIAVYITFDIPIFCRLFAGKRFVQGPFNLGRFSWPVHAWAVLITTYIMILACFPTTKNWTAATFNYDWVVALGIIGLAGCLWFFFGRTHYAGLNLAALNTVREEMDEERRRESIARSPSKTG